MFTEREFSQVLCFGEELGQQLVTDSKLHVEIHLVQRLADPGNSTQPGSICSLHRMI